MGVATDGAPRCLRMGLIGGGAGSFIGPIHRIASELDGDIELVAGTFSSDPDRSRQPGETYRIAAARAYGDIGEMFASERARADGIDFVTIASPNHHHLPAARAALEAGVPVLSDKPATATLAEAYELANIIARAGVPYGLTYTYSGYPLVREARDRVTAGALGTVRKIIVEYSQGFHVKDAEFRPNGRSGIYGGYQDWIDRPGRFRSLGDGQVDFTQIFARLAHHEFAGWAVLEWECALKHPEQGAAEGAPFIARHIIRVTDRAFNDFAAGGADRACNARLMGIA